MKCVRSCCRLEIPEGAKFCPSCGKKQPSMTTDPMTTDPDTPLVWDGERTICPRCRRETPAGSDSVFCTWCRMRLPVSKAPAVPIPVKLSGRVKACVRPCCRKAIRKRLCSARGAGNSSRQNQSPHESAARRVQERSTSCKGSGPSHISQRPLPVIYSATMQTEKRP